jgi:hypothetical protein
MRGWKLQCEREREGNTRRGWKLQCEIEREREILGGDGNYSARERGKYEEGPGSKVRLL